MANVIVSRKSGFIRRGGSMRRETAWLTDPTAEVTMSGAPTALLISSLNAAALALRPFTIIRTRGVIYIH